VSTGWIEGLWSNLLELEASHHGVEEDLQEGHVVSVSVLHDLDPLNADLVLLLLVLSVVHGKVCALSQGVEAATPVDEELQLLLDLVSHISKHILAELLRIVWNLGLKLDGVFVHTLDILLVEVNLEVVGEELQGFAGGFWVTCWFLWEKSKCSRFHLVSYGEK